MLYDNVNASSAFITETKGASIIGNTKCPLTEVWAYMSKIFRIETHALGYFVIIMKIHWKSRNADNNTTKRDRVFLDKIYL